MRLQDGLYCPVLICDHCGEQITDVQAATYAWPEEASHTSDADVVFLHRACIRAYQEGRQWHASEPLESFAVRLASNAGQGPTSLIQTARELKRADEGRRVTSLTLKCPSSQWAIAQPDAMGHLDIRCRGRFCRTANGGPVRHVFDLATGSYTTSLTEPGRPQARSAKRRRG
jgi:hypothetical protein